MKSCRSPTCNELCVKSYFTNVSKTSLHFRHRRRSRVCRPRQPRILSKRNHGACEERCCCCAHPRLRVRLHSTARCARTLNTPRVNNCFGFVSQIRRTRARFLCVSELGCKPVSSATKSSGSWLYCSSQPQSSREAIELSLASFKTLSQSQGRMAT